MQLALAQFWRKKQLWNINFKIYLIRLAGGLRHDLLAHSEIPNSEEWWKGSGGRIAAVLSWTPACLQLFLEDGIVTQNQDKFWWDTSLHLVSTQWCGFEFGKTEFLSSSCTLDPWQQPRQVFLWKDRANNMAFHRVTVRSEVVKPLDFKYCSFTINLYLGSAYTK